MADILYIICLELYRTSSHHQHRSAPLSLALQTPEPDFFCCLFGQTKQTSILLKIFRKYQNLAFQDMLVSSCNSGREIGKLSNKSTSSILDTESTSRRIACWLDVRMSMARAGRQGKVSVTAVPLVVMLQDYTWYPSTGPFQENKYIRWHQKNGCLRKSSLKPSGQRQNTCLKKHGLQCTTPNCSGHASQCS